MNITISGSLGSGKSTVCKILNERGDLYDPWRNHKKI